MTAQDADILGPGAPQDAVRPPAGRRAAPAAQQGRADIHGQVLENLLDGVLVIERSGAITVFNAAAERILGIPASEARGKTFGELFVMREGLEEFSELLLDTVGSWAPGGRQIVSLNIGNEARTLSVATSYVRTTMDERAEPVALIAAFSDITELRELRETELRMAKEVEAQHAELQTAYRRIEERNETLATTLKKVQTARILATILSIGVFLGIGAYLWQPLDLIDGGFSSAASLAPAGGAGEAGRPPTITLQPRAVRQSISLRGTLAPWRTVAVTGPFESRLAALHVEYGQEVAEGDLLFELDIAGTVREHREAQLRYTEAQKAFDILKNWETGSEMADSRRSFTRARLSLESQETALKRAAFLLEQGLIAQSDHEAAKRQHEGSLLDFEAAREDLEAARARGGPEALEKAELELSAVREEMQELAGQLGKARVHAPLAGVILAPSRPGGRPLAEGRLVGAGEALMTIGDFSRMAAIAKVDEIDVVRIATGQVVSVTGNAFPGLRLQGAVTHVSSQPDPRQRGAPRFEVKVTLDPLDAAQQERLRVGMSSMLQIVVYRNDAALVVPIDAVERRGGTHHVRVFDPDTGAVEMREVKVGPTDLDSVEIAAGLRAGDEIVVPGY